MLTLSGTRPETMLYRAAKKRLLSEGYAAEIDWQLGREFAMFTETDLLRETAWVILCAGFRESVVRQHFDFISLCFCDWESAHEICTHATRCRATALVAFRNQKKVEAILDTAALIKQVGFHQIKTRLLQDPIQSAQALPFIGPITAFHLLKNLGYGVAKPDRHLVRIAAGLGYQDVQQLCAAISMATGDPIQVVDLILWRYSVLHPTDRNGSEMPTAPPTRIPLSEGWAE